MRFHPAIVSLVLTVACSSGEEESSAQRSDATPKSTVLAHRNDDATIEKNERERGNTPPSRPVIVTNEDKDGLLAGDDDDDDDDDDGGGGGSAGPGRAPASLSIKPGSALDGRWKLTIDYSIGEVTMTMDGGSEFATLIVTRANSAEEIRIDDGTRLLIKNWIPACGAKPTGWDRWTALSPASRSRSPAIALSNQSSVIVWTGEDGLEGMAGALRFDDVDFGLDHDCL